MVILEGSVAYWPDGKIMCYNLTNSTIILAAMLDFSGRWYSKEIRFCRILTSRIKFYTKTPFQGAIMLRVRKTNRKLSYFQHECADPYEACLPIHIQQWLTQPMPRI